MATHLAELFCRFSSVRNLAARGTDTVAGGAPAVGVGGRACVPGRDGTARADGRYPIPIAAYYVHWGVWSAQMGHG